MINKELGQYKILAEIGRGGMGIVYRAYQKSLNREVALKILPPTLSFDENLVKRFHREAEAAAGLNHPNIIQIFDINEIEGIHFFAMEYLRGESLTQKIKREGPLPITEAVRITIDVADALSYSHAEGIIHRDIKPSNIMIDPHGHLKVTDFGLARAMESSHLTMTGTIIGTPEYMSPEQARGENLDGRSDLYSLGIVFYETLTARIPFEASTPFAVAQKQIYEPLPSPRSLRPEIPEVLENVILKSTEKNPEQRYQTGKDLKEDLEAFITISGLERITPTVPVSSREVHPIKASRVQETPLKRMPWGKISLAGATLLIVLFSLLFIPKKKALQKPEEKVKIVEEKPKEDSAVLPIEKSPEESAQKMMDDILRLIEQGAYSDAISRLEEFKEKFPDSPQANIIPQWIKDLRDREPAEKFNGAKKLAASGDVIQAILEFNQIARDYPGTEWETKSNEKVEELKKILKEGEAEKEFSEAEDLAKKGKFIEAVQLYQGIISRFPGSIWAKKSEEEITRLKEEQARLREKIVAVDQSPREEKIDQSPRGEEIDQRVPPEIDRRPGRDEGPSFKTEIDDLVRSDKQIMHFIIDEDRKGLAQYFQKNYPDKVQKWAGEVGLSKDAFLAELTQRMVEDMKREFGGPGREPMRREPPREREDISRKAEKFVEQIKRSDPKVQLLIRRGDKKELAQYLWLWYKEDLKKMARAIDIPEEEIAYVTARYLTGDDMAFEMGPTEGRERDFRRKDEEMKGEDFRRKDSRKEPEDFRREDEIFDKFRRRIQSDTTAVQYIDRRNVEGLKLYLMKQYHKELKDISGQLNRPLNILARDFSQRLVDEKEGPRYR